MFTEVRTRDVSVHGVTEAPLPAGALAGPWRIEDELGRGGMGAVYAVTHGEIGKRAALKVVHAHALSRWFTAERVLLEARVVNQVGHPGVVDIFDTGVLDDGRPYLVMERLDGETLGERHARAPVPAPEACDILLAVCDAIAAAHAAGVVHRDLKLDNVFLVDGDDGALAVKVLDWGIAKVLTGDPGNSFAEHLIGTPRYISPEQARGGEVTPQADVYSLGVMMYELFLGAPPFVADSAAELLVMHLRDQPAPPRERWPECPFLLDDLIVRMLGKDPACRPSIDEVMRRLRAVRGAQRSLEVAVVDGPVDPSPLAATAPMPAMTLTAGAGAPAWSRPIRLALVVALLIGATLTAGALTAADDAHARAPSAEPGAALAPRLPSPPALVETRVAAPAARPTAGPPRAAPAAVPGAARPRARAHDHAHTPAHAPASAAHLAVAADPDGTIEPY